MKNIKSIILLVICLMFLILPGTAGAQQIPCICLDENGAVINYSVNDPASVYCYACTGNVCEKTNLTLQMCRALNTAATAQAEAAAAVAIQPVKTEEPPVQPPAPAAEEPGPAAPAPVIEQPAPVVPEPAAEQPVPAAPAPVIEQPAPAVPEPAAEQPVPAAPAPVFEQPAPTVPEPAAEQPVPAAPAPVIEQPAPAVPEPAAEQPVQVIAEPAVEQSVPASEQPSPEVSVPVIQLSVPGGMVITSSENDSGAGISGSDEEAAPAEKAAEEVKEILSEKASDEVKEVPTEEATKEPEGASMDGVSADPEAAPTADAAKKPKVIPVEVMTKEPEAASTDGMTADPEMTPAAESGKKPEAVPAEIMAKDTESASPAGMTVDPETVPAEITVKDTEKIPAEGAAVNPAKDESAKTVDTPAGEATVNLTENESTKTADVPVGEVTVNPTENESTKTVDTPAGEAIVNPTENGSTKTVDAPVGEATVNPTENESAKTVDIPANDATVNPAENESTKTVDVPADEAGVNPTEEKPSGSETPERPASYIVQEGDTCESIAIDLFGTNYDLFMLMNDMAECSIEAGQTVLIPTEEEEEDYEANQQEESVRKPEGKKSLTVSIEGKPKDIGLSSPSGETFTTAAVPFTWVYTVSDDSNPVEVEFKLTLNINNLENGQKTVSVTTVSSASCKNFICTYTAGSELSGFIKAEVTWTVSGTYDDGGSPVTVGSNPAEKTFKLDVKDPTPTPVPTPTATPKPKPEKPKAPVQECPVGRYTVRSLGFYWAPSENAETYTVAWNNDRNQSGTLDLSNNDPTCKKGRCIAYTTLPGVGRYVWTVTAKNVSGSAKSKEMAFEIATNVSTPTAYLPNGTIYSSSYPAFQWENVEDGVFEYRIQIVGKNDGRIRYDRWFDVKDIYVGNGVCYVKTNLFLPAGTYSWRVLGRNADFSSRWSSWLDFYVQCDYCNYNNVYYGNYANTIPSTSYPTAVITTTSPEFQWRTLTGASYYQVRVTDSAGKEVFAKQVPSSYCTVEMCTWDPGIKLPGNGNYSWTVSGYGPSGGFWGSSTGAFTVQAQIVINPMSFVSPEQNGYLNPESPLIIWTDPGDTAVLYNVQIFDAENNLLLNAELDRDQAWCDGLTCSIAFQTIPDGVNYRIVITPYSEYNTQGDMIELVFSKGGRSIRLASPKEGSTVQSRPLFRWMLEDGENAVYDLILTDSENNVTIYSPLACGSGGMTCEDGEAFFSPAQALAAGSYTAELDIPAAGVKGEALTFIVQ